MLNKLEELIKSLPPLPESVSKINKALSDQDNGFKILTKEIKGDPMISSLILGIINSPAFSLRTEIDTIERAIALLGLKEVAKIALRVIIEDRFEFNLKPYGLTEERFKSINVENVILAKSISNTKYKEFQERLSMVSYFLNLGKILISKLILETNNCEEFKASIKEHGVIKSELEFIGITSIEATIYILRYFNLQLLAEDLSLSLNKNNEIGGLINIIVNSHEDQIGKLTDSSFQKIMIIAMENNLDPEILTLIKKD